MDRWLHTGWRAKKHKRGFIIGQVATHGTEERRSIKHDNEQNEQRKKHKRRPITGQVSTWQRIDSGQVSTGQRKCSQGLVCIII